MINKNFDGWLNTNHKNNLIAEFKKNLERILLLKETKINTDLDDYNQLYSHFQHEIKSYKNLIYFRLYDLGSTLLYAIEKKNYTTATIISRGIFETQLMYAFRMNRIIKIIDNNKWSNLYIEILNLKIVPSWKDDGTINFNEVFPDLKKFHINDAIRNISINYSFNKDEQKTIEKMFFKYYGEMSEISHPTQANRSLYVMDRDKFDLEKQNKKIYRDSFSVNHGDNKVFPIFSTTMGTFKDVINLSELLLNQCLDKLIKFKVSIVAYEKSSKRKDDLIKAQPILNNLEQLSDKGLANNEIVDAIINMSYSKKH